MKTVLKWVLRVLGGLVVLAVVAIGIVLILGQLSWKRSIPDRPLYEIEADTSPEGVAHGEYLVRHVIGCGGCHGEGAAADDSPEAIIEHVLNAPLTGSFLEVQDGPISFVFAPPNLTPDDETGLGTWTDAEIARAIREGLGKDGVALVIMPSSEFHGMSDEDVADIVGYLRSLEPVRNDIPPVDGNAPAKGLIALGAFGPRPLGEPITEPVLAPQAGTVEYGEYLMSFASCTLCHGESLSGSTEPQVEGQPNAANLTPGGELAGWTEEDFLTTLRTGVNPAGRELDGVAMPWEIFKDMTDEDLGSIFMYLQTLPALEQGKK